MRAESHIHKQQDHKMDCLYYTDGVVHDRRTLTKLCLLFDTVRTFHWSPFHYLEQFEERWLTEKHEPVFDHPIVSKELLTNDYLATFSKFTKKNHQLISARVLQPIVVKQPPRDGENLEQIEKEMMEHGSHLKLFLWGQSIGLVPRDIFYADSHLFALYRWQSISSALHFAIQTGQIPMSDNTVLSQLACSTVSKFPNFDYRPSADEIGNRIAFRAMSLLLPDFPALTSEQILEARDKLAGQLHRFRSEMTKIATNVDEGGPLDIDALVIREIEPRLNDLRLKIRSLNSELFRKIAATLLAGAGVPLLSYFLSLPVSSQIVAAGTLAGKILLDVHGNLSKRNGVRSKSINHGLVFLLDMEKLSS